MITGLYLVAALMGVVGIIGGFMTNNLLAFIVGLSSSAALFGLGRVLEILRRLERKP